MSKQVASGQQLFSGDFDQAELERILERIDEYLELRPLLRPAEPTATPVQQQTTPDLTGRLLALKDMQAPLFVIKGRSLANQLKRLINLPIRVFGYKQIRFNRELLELLELLLGELAANRQGNEQQLAALTTHQGGQDRWMQLLDRKLQMLALDVREGRAAASSAQVGIPEPYILDQVAFKQRLEAMGNRVRVNLGCGEQPWPGYINVDMREMPGADVVADVRDLPFEAGSLAELASAHLVEHFREHQLRKVILPYWKGLLQPDGALRIICPNWAAMLRWLNEGRLSLEHFKLLTFGAQDYEGDDHFAMYTPETLSALLRSCGFIRVEVLAEERVNGLCPEMELLAHV